MRTSTIAVAVAAALLPAAASAQSMATTTTDLNLRAGPGSNYQVLTTMPRGAEVNLNGCVEGTNWCQVNFSGTTGYAYDDYLMAKAEGNTVVVTENRSVFPTVSFDNSTATGALGGAVVGALVGGPVGAAIGAGAGAAAANIQPSAEVVDFISTNTLDPVFLDGEVQVGVAVPETVTLVEVPSSEYRYVNINGEPVLVDPQSRQIVYVYR